jgi:hypothetical protein
LGENWAVRARILIMSELNKYLTQEPRNSAFFKSDVSDTAESVNWAALEHSGKDNERYKHFLLAVAEEIVQYAKEI